MEIHRRHQSWILATLPCNHDKNPVVGRTTQGIRTYVHCCYHLLAVLTIYLFLQVVSREISRLQAYFKGRVQDSHDHLVTWQEELLSAPKFGEICRMTLSSPASLTSVAEMSLLCPFTCPFIRYRPINWHVCFFFIALLQNPLFCINGCVQNICSIMHA